MKTRENYLNYVSNLMGEPQNRLYKLEHKERINTLIEIENKINSIIDKQIKAENYHKKLIAEMKQKNTAELGDTDRFYHILKLKLLKQGYSEEEYEELLRSTIL